MPTPLSDAVEANSVLIVDDQPANVALLVQALEGMDLRLHTAHDGPSALALLDSAPIDLILLDAMMPGMSGFDVAQAVRARRADELLPIVMVTALDSQEDLERAFLAGANDFLRKPVNIAEVRARVRSFLQLRRQERELARALRAAKALGEFQQDLSQLLVHDLKGPLATIRVLTHLVRDELAAAPLAVPDDLAAIEQTCDKLGDMVLGLIDISRMEQAAIVLDRKPVDLGALAREALKTYAAQAAERGIAFEAHGEAVVQGDPGLLGRVVGNLVENAISHTPDGGAVMVYAFGDSSGKRTLRVTNTGSSLPMAERTKVFEKYGRGRSNAGGRMHRGLGLYFCRLAVEAHGGTIGIEGKEEGPITFVVTLHETAADAAAEESPSAATAEPDGAARSRGSASGPRA